MKIKNFKKLYKTEFSFNKKIENFQSFGKKKINKTKKS